MRKFAGSMVALFVLGAMIAGLVQLNTPTPAYAEICPGFPETCSHGAPQKDYDAEATACYYGTHYRCSSSSPWFCCCVLAI